MCRTLCAVLIVCGSFIMAQAQMTRGTRMVPSGKGYGIPGSALGDTVNQGNGIDYNGGRVMPRNVKVYLIWYGNWTSGPSPSDSQETVDLITTLINSIGGTPYEQINTTYGDATNDVTGQVSLGGTAKLPLYPNGSGLTDADVLTVVKNLITRGRLPLDSNGVYFVLTTTDVGETSGFCSAYCGWHKRANINRIDVKYSFVGNPDRCPSSCEVQSISPNNNSGGDGMASLVAGELNATVTDPDLNAWFNTGGLENADLCGFKWGQLLGGSIGNGGYNQQMGGLNWLIQTNWENARGGGCDNFLGGPFWPK